MANKKCGQMQCGFNVMGGCQKCSVCGANPNEVNEHCDKCYNCENDEGLLRWDMETKEKEAELIKQKLMELLGGKKEKEPTKEEKEEKIKQACYVS